MTKEGDKDGFTKVIGKAERKTVSKKAEIVKHDVPPVRERHFKIRFEGERGKKHELPQGVTQERIRVVLNKTLKSLNIDGYFSMVGKKR